MSRAIVLRWLRTQMPLLNILQKDITIRQALPDAVWILLIVNLVCVSVTTVAMILRTLEKYVGRCFRVEIVTMLTATICLLVAGILVYALKEDENDKPKTDLVVSLLLASFSAVMALTCTSLKLYIFAKRSYHSSGTLGRQSAQERQLILFFNALIVYILLTGPLFAGIEGWDSHDGIYFIITTIFTIGTGDLVPSTTVGMALLPLVAICGIVLVGFVVFSTRAVIFGYYLQRLLREIENAESKGHPHAYLPGQRPSMNNMTEFTHLRLTRSATTTAVETPNVASHLFSVSSLASSSDPVQIIQSRHLKTQFLLAFVLIMIVIALFSTILTFSEDWSFFLSAFFVFTTFATIGYGTPAPNSQLGKAAFVWFVLIGVGGLAWLSSILSEAVDVWWERIFLGVQARIWKRSVIRSLKSESALLNIPTFAERRGGDLEMEEFASMGRLRPSESADRDHQRTLSTILNLPGYRVLRPRTRAPRSPFASTATSVPPEEEKQETQHKSGTLDALCLATSGDALVSPLRGTTSRAKQISEEDDGHVVYSA